LPRTDYTGETHYATSLAKASNGAFSANYLLEPIGELSLQEKGTTNHE